MVNFCAQLASLIDKASAKGLADFNGRFEEIFKLQGKGYGKKNFSADEMDAAKAAFSNMVGGMGYFYGRAIIKPKEGADDTLKVCMYIRKEIGVWM